MTSTSTDTAALVRFPELFETLSTRLDALASAIVAESDDEELLELAEKLRTVVKEATDVIETVNFERLPDAIDGEELPDAIDAERLADALEASDATEMIDLAELYEAIDIWELWKTVDLPALRKEGEELNVELADLLGNGDGTSDGEDDEMIDGTVGALLGAESRQQAIVQRLDAVIDAFRVALCETHATVRRLYEANQRDRSRGSRLRARNPTGRSTMPRGPLAASASTRVSTVPRRVRHSRTKGRSRVYGRRFEHVRGR